MVPERDATSKDIVSIASEEAPKKQWSGQEQEHMVRVIIVEAIIQIMWE